MPSRHTVNSRRAPSPLVTIVEGEKRWEAPNHFQEVFPENCGVTEQNRTVTCMVLKAKTNDRQRPPSEATFTGEEYLHFDVRGSGGEPLVSWSDQVSLQFRSRQSAGLLFFAADLGLHGTGNEDFLHVSLKGGGIAIHTKLGSGHVEKIIRPSKVRFDDNQWHKIVIHRKVRESRQQRAFAVEAYFSNGRSVIGGKLAFRRHFDIPPRGRVPDRKCVLIRMDAFRVMGSVFKERKGSLKTVRTPENVERISVLIQTGMGQ
ncbi:LAM_G_DOMAIN domain-containing protein [Trichonephila clavipes]|nr:LAM_G_DOMAIN domain-containing protein [Trichonephila clavipes]